MLGSGAIPTGHRQTTLTPGSRLLARRATEHAHRQAVARHERRRTASRKHGAIQITLELMQQQPTLAQHLRTHPVKGLPGWGWPPTLTRRNDATTGQLNALYRLHGPLVLLTVNLDTLDTCTLKSQEVAQLSREIVQAYLDELATPDPAYTASPQRGDTGHTHAHLVIPLAHLKDEHAQVIQATPKGRAGCLLLDGDAHAVLIGNTTADRQKVAAYLSRDPDARLDDPNSPAYLQALEEELTRKAQGHRSPRLSWKQNIPNGRP